jgi:hypothetical protein
MENVEEVAATLSPSPPPAPHPAAFKAASLPKGTVARPWLRQQGHSDFIPLTAAHNQEYHVPVPGEPILEVRDKRGKTGDRFALVDRAGKPIPEPEPAAIEEFDPHDWVFWMVIQSPSS